MQNSYDSLQAAASAYPNVAESCIPDDTKNLSVPRMGLVCRHGILFLALRFLSFWRGWEPFGEREEGPEPESKYSGFVKRIHKQHRK